jgi:F-type H+-transporting ATPase subunit a
MLEISLKPEVLTKIGSIPITNAQMTSWLSSLILIIVALLVGINYKRLPTGLQHIFEMVYELFQNMAEEAMGKFGQKFVPLLCTIFLFIITANWMGVLPGVGSLVIVHDAAKSQKAGIMVLGDAKAADDHAAPAKPATDSHGAPAEAAKDAHAADAAHEVEHAYVPIFRGGNADLNTTFALALIAQVIVHAMGIKTAGLKHHLAHFKNPLEIVSELSKILSFGFRLFGNVFAGEVLLLAMSSILAIILRNYSPAYGLFGGIIVVPFLLLELFVGFIQAFVFAMLTLSFLSLFVKTDKSAAHH